MSLADHPKPDTSVEEQPDAKKQKTEETTNGADSTTSAPKYTLYGYWRSSSTWRTRIALHLKGIPFKYEPVNLLKSETQTEDYAKKNPQKKVPLLYIDENKNIAQSLAIIDYLEQAHPETPSLLPKDPYLRAKALSLAEGVNSDIQPLHNLGVLGRVGQMGGDQAKQEWGNWVVMTGLKALEENVAAMGGKYCVGDEITITDVCLVPQLSAARRFNADLKQFPNLLRIEKELSTHPAFIAGHANAQPDKPADMAPIE